VTVWNAKATAILHASISPDIEMQNAKRLYTHYTQTLGTINHTKQFLCTMHDTLIFIAFVHMRYFQVFISKSLKHNTILILCITYVKRGGGAVNNSKTYSSLLYAINAHPSHNNNECILHTNIAKRHYISRERYHHKNGNKHTRTLMQEWPVC
jgi:hypothetical protein